MTENLPYKIANLTDLSSEQQQDVASTVADYTTNVGHKEYKMLALSYEEVRNRMGQVAFVGGKIAGYVGASGPEEGPHGNMSEVGSLFVLEKYQQRGIAKGLLKAAINNLSEKEIVPYIFCNDNSLPAAKAVGFEPTETSEVPACATDACSGCVAM